MPPSDPRLCPDLERALPADSAVFTGYRKTREPWEAEFGDGGWHPVEARAWWLDRHRRQVVQIEWSIKGESWGGTYLYDPRKMRPAVDGVWQPTQA
jgi:hypothetical protein